MLNFCCPTCKSTIAAPEDMAGAKVSCLKCGQRILIPSPRRNKTVLGEPVDAITAKPPAPKPPTAGLAVAIGPCPSCGKQLSVAPEMVGRWVSCACGMEFAAATPDDPTSEETPETAPLFTKKAAVTFAVVAGILGGLCLLVYVGYQLFVPAGTFAEARSGPRVEEEELVKRFIVRNDANPDSVVFLAWGPHMFRDELWSLLKEAGIPSKALAAEEVQGQEFRAIIRVQYRAIDDAIEFPNITDAILDPSKAKEKRKKERLKDYDSLFLVAGKIVLPLSYSPTVGRGAILIGDDWKKKARKYMGRVFPGISD